MANLGSSPSGSGPTTGPVVVGVILVVGVAVLLGALGLDPEAEPRSVPSMAAAPTVAASPEPTAGWEPVFRWETFLSEERGFKVDAPRPHFSEVVETEKFEGEELQYLTFSFGPRYGPFGFWIVILDFGSGGTYPVLPDPYYDYAAAELEAQTGGKLIGQASVDVQGVRCRDYFLEDKEYGHLTVRLCLAGSRIYEISAANTSGNRDAVSVERFIESFRMLDRPDEVIG